MAAALTLQQIADIIRLHPEALAKVAQQSVITADTVAYAVSCMVVDNEVSRSVVSASTGVPRDDLRPGFGCMMQATLIFAATVAAHPHDQIAAVLYDAVIPGFSASTGTVQ